MNPQPTQREPVDLAEGLVEIVRDLEASRGALRDSTAERDVALARRLERAARHVELAARVLIASPAELDELDGASERVLDAALDLFDGLPRSSVRRASTGSATGRAGQCGLRGSTSTLSIADLVGFLSTMRKDGVLRLETQGEDFFLQLENGAVVYAQGDAPPVGMRLGEILVDQGALTPAQLDSFFESSEEGEFLGSGLLERGLITPEALVDALGYQVQQVFHRMHAAGEATFSFEEGEHVVVHRDISLNVTHLLLETARSYDEEHRVQLDALEG